MRILVDHYHDSGWTKIHRAQSGGPTHVTICREPLKWSTLKQYHVVIINATAPAPVNADELEAIERFVSEGGGLLIAGSAPQFEVVTGGQANQMPAARFAELFSIGFLPGEDAPGELYYDRDFRLGYRGEDARTASDVIEGFGPHPPAADVWAPLQLCAPARPLLVHGETDAPLAAVTEHGEGRVCVCAADLDGFNVLAHLHPLLRWLSTDRELSKDRPAGEIGPTPVVRDIHGLKLICDHAIVGRAEELATLIRRFDEFMTQLIGSDWQTPRVLRALQTSRRPRLWDDDLFLAPAGADWAMAYNVAVAITNSALWHKHPGNLLVSLFPEATIARHIALRFLDHLGFTIEADRLRKRAALALEALDPTRTEADLARIYSATEQWHPKGEWLLSELERRFGDDFLRRLFKVLPTRPENDLLPRSFAWHADRLAYYLGLAAGETLTHFLREIGTTLHPLPLVPPNDDAFEPTMRGTLIDEVLGTSSPTGVTRRMEALSDLSRLKPEQRAELPGRARELTEAFERSVASDVRAVPVLEALARDDRQSDAAWAALQLVTMGRAEWSGRLAELLPQGDLRFRLMAGHALNKLGHGVSEGSLEGLTAAGAAVGEMDIEHYNELLIQPKVDGYQVANVLAESGFSGFPHGNWATRFYVYWVHTSAQWRRSGLSRQAFKIAMEHEEAQRCSCFALATGMRNTAHALYREFGYVDLDRREGASKQLYLGTPGTPPDGVAIRPITDEDAEGVRRFLADYHEDAFTLSPLPVPQLGAGTFATVAERDDTLIGVAFAQRGSLQAADDAAELMDLAVSASVDNGTDVAVALMSRLHVLLAEDGAKQVRTHLCSDPGLLTDVLSRCGYSRQPTEGVNMFGIRDLTQLFREIQPLFERRLRASSFEDWRGRVILLSERLSSGFEIETGEVRVLQAPEPGALDITLRTTEEHITRMVTGRETPLEGYLQNETVLTPQVSPAVVKLLETLFPRMPFVLHWGW